ncbi:MAG: alkaline phosphatase D family protein [Acidimicrobiia bacterium]
MTGASLSRRQVVRGLGALAAAPVLRRPQASRRGGPGGGDELFRWGVASFDPTASGILLWTRARPDDGSPVPLRWQLFADADLTRPVAGGTATAEAGADHCVTVEATGLPAGGIWWYRFETADGSAASPTGRTRTLPEGPVARWRVATVSCSRYAAGGFAAYRALAGREVDLVVHLGDYVYEDGASDARAHDPPEELRTLDQYRRRYAQHREDPDLQALHARHPMVAVWDDHELAGNAWRDGAQGHDPSTGGPWDARRRAATQAHGEWVPGRTRTGEDGRLVAWRSVLVGDLAEVLVLDARSWRDRQPTAATEVAQGRDRDLLGPEQRAWLEARLTRSDRPPWVLLANQVMLHPLRVPVPSAAVGAQVEAQGFLVVDGLALNPDQWDGYPAEREALLAAAGPEGGVVVLTGDVHSSWGWEGPGTDDDGRPAMVELVTPSVSAASLGDRLPVPPTVLEAAIAAVDPDLAYVELTRHGYLLVDLGADEAQAEWWYVDPADPASQAFGAARRTPRATPMHLAAVAGPRPDPAPTTTTTTVPPPPPTGAAGEPRDGRDGGPGLVVGGAIAAAATAAGAVVALRRRR